MNPTRRIPRRRSRLALALVAGLAATWPTPAALAVDGVQLIDATCALAGCFPGDAPGYPVTISQAGSYRLASDLEVADPALDGIDVTAGGFSGVSLDLNGFTIQGGYACSISPPNCAATAGYGISTSTLLRVSNGVVTYFGLAGIHATWQMEVTNVVVRFIGGNGIESTQGARLRDLTIQATRHDGVHVLTGSITDSIFSAIAGDGIDTDSLAVRDVAMNGVNGKSIRFSGMGSYAGCQLSTAPVGGTNLGKNACGSGVCP